MMPMGLEPEPGLQLTNLRNFALAEIGSRLRAEQDLITAFWNQIGAPATPKHPDLTVLYYSMQSLGQTFVLLEFIAGETLEEFVKRCDPDSCEQEIPMFCRLL